jgi:hypothetical protein
VRLERRPPVDCQSNIAQEVGDRPLERARSQDGSVSHPQADQHTCDTFDINGHWDPLLDELA